MSDSYSHDTELPGGRQLSFGVAERACVYGIEAWAQRT